MEADLGVVRWANPVSAEQHSADHRHVTMARLRLYALTTVGGLILLCELFIEAVSPDGPSFDNLVWILLVIPLYAVGAWLTWRLPRHPQPVRLLIGGTGAVASGALGLLIADQPQLINSPWFPLDLHPFRATNIRAVHKSTISTLVTRSFWRLLDSRCLICEV